MAKKITSPLKAGRYDTSAVGFNGVIKVTTTLSENRIEGIEITEQSETPGIGAPLTPEGYEGETPVKAIPQRIVKQQSLNVAPTAGAAITSKAIIKAVSKAIEQAGGNVDDWKQNEYFSAADEEDTYDVIVVGGGGAGLVAAISAAQQGASVLIVEKNGAIGGNLLISGGIYNCPDKELQSKVKLNDAKRRQIDDELKIPPVNDKHRKIQQTVAQQWAIHQQNKDDTLFDTPEWYALQTFDGGDFIGNLDLIEIMCKNSEAAYRWLVSLGTEFRDNITQGPGSLWQRTHSSPHILGTGFIASYARQLVREERIRLVTNTSVTELLFDDKGSVSGVVTKNNENTEKTYHSNKGVILATGGFSASKEMVKKYNTSQKWAGIDLSKAKSSNRFSGSQGDGIKLGTSAGAGLTQMEQIQLLFLSNIKTGAINMYPPRCVNGIDQLIFVNKEGKRFVREDGRRDEVCLSVLSQTDAVFYCIESGDGNAPDIENGKTADGFPLKTAENLGFIFIADTLEELADKIGINAETLIKTVEQYNRSVETNNDDLGRTLFSVKLTKGPWIATPRTAGIHHTMGGIVIDGKARAIDKNGKPIPHLYAAGEVTGGIHGGNRLGGNAVVDTVVFGKIAGEAAADAL